MKTKRRLIQTCLLAGALLLPAVMQAQFTFTTNNGAITITKYTGPGGAVTIPGTIKGLPVNSIGNRAFASIPVTTVLVPDSVITIGSKVFFHCGSLTNVTLGSGVASLGVGAFDYCSKLKSVDCRGNAPTLGGLNVFTGTPATVYYLPGTTGWQSKLGGRPTVLWNPAVPFNYTTTTGTITITGYIGSGGAVTIPSSINFLPVTSIGDQAFDSCTILTSIIIPKGVTSIGKRAFEYCSSLNSVMIPNSVASIGAVAFYSCTSLTNITIPNGVTIIEGDTFEYCFSLTSINIPDSVTDIEEFAFDFCDSLANVTIPKNVVNLGQYAFYDCEHLTSVTIPSHVPSIGQSAFSDCISLTNVIMLNGVTSIGETAFESCYHLISVTIPNSVTSIGDGAFLYCPNLTNLEIPNSVSRIGNSAFAECYSLTNITIPKSVTGIGIEAFARCPRLMSFTVDASNSSFSSIDGVLFDRSHALLVEFPGGRTGNYIIPNSVTSIGGYAFEFCTSLTSVTIPNSVSYIWENAFVSCTGLSSLAILGPVTSLGTYAFAYCANLKTIFFAGNVPSYVYPYVFYYSPNVTVYYLPGTTGWGATFAGAPTALWNPQAQTNDGSFGVQTNQFGFNITGSSNLVIVVEACTNLFNPLWQPVQTNTLTTGTSYFSDPQWTNFPGRFYRLRSP